MAREVAYLYLASPTGLRVTGHNDYLFWKSEPRTLCIRTQIELALLFVCMESREAITRMISNDLNEAVSRSFVPFLQRIFENHAATHVISREHRDTFFSEVWL